MDPVKANEAATINSCEETPSSRSPTKGILRKSKTSFGRQQTGIIERTPIKRTATSTIKRTQKVSFSDKAKNIPICTIYEVEPLQYEEPASPKGRSCACFIF